MGMSMRWASVTAFSLSQQAGCARRRPELFNRDLLNHCGAGVSYPKEDLIS
jgi:hypothetical protein